MNGDADCPGIVRSKLRSHARAQADPLTICRPAVARRGSRLSSATGFGPCRRRPPLAACMEAGDKASLLQSRI